MDVVLGLGLAAQSDPYAGGFDRVPVSRPAWQAMRFASDCDGVQPQTVRLRH